MVWISKGSESHQPYNPCFLQEATSDFSIRACLELLPHPGCVNSDDLGWLEWDFCSPGSLHIIFQPGQLRPMPLVRLIPSLSVMSCWQEYRARPWTSILKGYVCETPPSLCLPTLQHGQQTCTLKGHSLVPKGLRRTPKAITAPTLAAAAAGLGAQSTGVPREGMSAALPLSFASRCTTHCMSVWGGNLAASVDLQIP